MHPNIMQLVQVSLEQPLISLQQPLTFVCRPTSAEVLHKLVKHMLLHSLVIVVLPFPLYPPKPQCLQDGPLLAGAVSSMSSSTNAQDSLAESELNISNNLLS
jgi:hypothetical protein